MLLCMWNYDVLLCIWNYDVLSVYRMMMDALFCIQNDDVSLYTE